MGGRRMLWVAMLLGALPGTLRADGEKDNSAESVRRIPKLGVEISSEDRASLDQQLQTLTNRLDSLRKNQQNAELLPDIEIYRRAVRTALENQEFFSQKDVEAAKELLSEGLARADALAAGDAPWTRETGLVVRGYVSKIDHTVQPYGLVIPDSYAAQGTDRVRLDLWFHGRGETLSEVSFLQQRRKQVGRYAPADTIVLHPYGRYSNAFKFAGEVDVLEALADAQKRYRIDPDRISVRGFSMGGAACWQFAVHYADRWFAANPGAGFSETPEFLKFFQKETLEPTWYERKLWHLYDCTDYAVNLYHCPTVAYSGELDIQKQAADIMEQALEEEGIDLVHIIGPGTKHSIHADAAVEIENRMASLAAVGRRQVPRHVHLVTYTLKYPRMKWVEIQAMGQHWAKARVDAALVGRNRVGLKTENVTALKLSMAPGECPLDMLHPSQLLIDGQEIEGPRPMSDRSWECVLHRQGDQWQLGPAEEKGLRKKHDLQGPIDDAFMDSFIFVRPTGSSSSPLVESWTRSELEHAIEHWRRQFRGDARVEDDKSITEEDIAGANLVLFGDPQSNAVLAKVIDELPIGWDSKQITVGDRHYSAAEHAPVLIYPNPLNPERYVVLNSGFTYREYDYLNNARQVPKLPDWAIVDLRTPVGSRYPGKVVEADFFGEDWQLRPAHASE